MSRFIGAILLVAGTTIGAGMLALPVVTSFAGFFPSILLFGICWVLMLSSAYFFLDVHISIGGRGNFISMIHKTLGKKVGGLGWCLYLLLLYCLMAAYIAASAPLFSATLALGGLSCPSWLSPFFLPFVFSGLIYLGTSGVDCVNRILMVGLALAYFLLVGSLPGHIRKELLFHIDWSSIWVALPVVITSFGYHIIIPSLVEYMDRDIGKVRRALFVGSAIPLFTYIFWQVVVLGTLPLEGEGGLRWAWRGGMSATASLVRTVAGRPVEIGAHFFPFFAVVTSFLGVSISLADFLVDALGIKRDGRGKLGTLFLLFIPPLVFVFAYQRGFIVALEYAGAFVAILLLFLPAVMAWNLRTPRFYRSSIGRLSLSIAMLFAIGVVIVDLLAQWGCVLPVFH